MGIMISVRDAFGIVLFVVVVAGVLAAVASLAVRRSTYEQIGKGGLFEDAAARRRPGEGGGDGASSAVRDEEIRQMLTARNALRAAHGGEQVDVEAEIAALARPVVDSDVEAEIRQLVEARNARRAAKGRPLLDVESEVARSIRELGG